mmetsp:Transcript_29945/g.66242  ORF Transcript_29945/g.66242 Transcript_29945/m.66242 type:complete len:238 (-) Transcript_29945:1341-2054(-)
MTSLARAARREGSTITSGFVPNSQCLLCRRSHCAAPLWGAGNCGQKDCCCSRCEYRRCSLLPSMFWLTSSEDMLNRVSLLHTPKSTSLTLNMHGLDIRCTRRFRSPTLLKGTSSTPRSSWKYAVRTRSRSPKGGCGNTNSWCASSRLGTMTICVGSTPPKSISLSNRDLRQSRITFSTNTISYEAPCVSTTPCSSSLVSCTAPSFSRGWVMSTKGPTSMSTSGLVFSTFTSRSCRGW